MFSCLISHTKGLLLYETFQSILNEINDISTLEKQFIILENNLLSRFPNYTNEDIPDFDYIESTDNYNNNSFNKHYSYCRHIDNIQYVEYIEYETNSNLVIKELFIRPQKELTIHELPSNLNENNLVILSEENNTLEEIRVNLFHNLSISNREFLLDTLFISQKKTDLQLISTFAEMIGFNLTFYKTTNKIKTNIRKELFDTLEKYWRFNNFREFAIYSNLSESRQHINISQGDIVETVVQQAEKAFEGKFNYKNILLTAPTGAGKSLLFQLSAMYLSNKYQLLTIVVSPLVALMKDQVYNLKHKYQYYKVASITGDLTPDEKTKIINEVKGGLIDILYLSPEQLLSYDIKLFIGERRIGLFVVDEAHCVTTRGRDFRVDYWFLGKHIRKIKKYTNNNFPIFALTATAVWDPKGENDMVFETIKSLYMDPCINYIGVVRRENIRFEISKPDYKQYNHDKLTLTKNTIIKLLSEKQKTIVYFPYRNTIEKLWCAFDDNTLNLRQKIRIYKSDLPTKEKSQNAIDFRNGNALVMLATKAFGMGVDVQDIKVVYHFAPSGNLSDYIQEIGRLARDKNITGIAKIDFCNQDFRFMRTLHGLSQIKEYQLTLVLKKLMELYHLKGKKRNLLISSTDFEYIFPGKKVDYDQKVKSCFLLLENDLRNKYPFDVIIVRPKSLFTQAYIRIKNDLDLFLSKYKEFIKPEDIDNNIYILDLEKLWYDNYRNYSFAIFKHNLYTNHIFDSNIEILTRIDLKLNYTFEQIQEKTHSFFSSSNDILDHLCTLHKYISEEELKSQISVILKTQFDPEIFYNAFISIYSNFFDFRTIDNEIKFRPKGGYMKVSSRYTGTLKQMSLICSNTENSFFAKNDSKEIDIAKLLNSLEIATYQISGGLKPSIFIRINDPYKLDKLSRSNNYKNDILKSIYKRFEISLKVFEHFFTTELDDNRRWNFIEDYFVGTPVEDLLKNYK